ncbi:hypothetical protein HHX38_00795 [Streptomyces sp. PKU-MA01144]|uniref:hypothetical protein n=1 Tax=Streptomyces sp. PKU-MA01144 TaxID=2729138 RepID=UPI00147BC5B4|nr:hypothetical protein [Streptomyces sp. PKU-MA01144]NNJ02689.1 hypothetical protein [Streptomyces sp. PKU-MA01144]
MSLLPELLRDGAVLAGATGILYAASVTAVAVTSVFAHCPERRRDARETLAILLRRRVTR